MVGNFLPALELAQRVRPCLQPRDSLSGVTSDSCVNVGPEGGRCLLQGGSAYALCVPSTPRRMRSSVRRFSQFCASSMCVRASAL